MSEIAGKLLRFGGILDLFVFFDQPQLNPREKPLPLLSSPVLAKPDPHLAPLLLPLFKADLRACELNHLKSPSRFSRPRFRMLIYCAASWDKKQKVLVFWSN